MTQAAPGKHTHHRSLTMPRVFSPPVWNLTSLHRIYKNTPPRRNFTTNITANFTAKEKGLVQYF